MISLIVAGFKHKRAYDFKIRVGKSLMWNWCIATCILCHRSSFVTTQLIQYLHLTWIEAESPEVCWLISLHSKIWEHWTRPYFTDLKYLFFGTSEIPATCSLLYANEGVLMFTVQDTIRCSFDSCCPFVFDVFCHLILPCD